MNLLIFHLHDMGRYCSPYGYPMPTPNMEAFAKRATTFRNAHAAAPTCSPSRAALLTGQTAHQAGMLGLRHRGFDLSDYSQHLAAFLGTHGYQTAYAGVQHEFNPDGDQDPPYAIQLDRSAHPGSHDQQAAAAAAAFLKDPPEDPFFLWVGTIYPHREFLKADPKRFNPDRLRPPEPLPDTPETRQDMADYMATLEHADQCFGTVMQALKDSGKDEETVVILTTDHGIAFPDMKCNLTAYGTGVAFLMDYPGNPLRGAASDALVSHLDVFPTLCELLGLDAPEHLIGNSLLPLFRGETEAIREEAFAEVNYHAGREIMRSVRTERYNLIEILDENPNRAMVNIDGGPAKYLWMGYGMGNSSARDRIQLYDLVFDPMERHNLAHDPAYRDARLEMQQRLKRWMVMTDDPAIRGSVQPPSDARLDARNAVEPT
jgi:arylsulfatase A-like enzyme